MGLLISPDVQAIEGKFFTGLDTAKVVYIVTVDTIPPYRVKVSLLISKEVTSMTQKTIVYVLNKRGEPLMATTRCGHVRKLLKEGRAVAVGNCPFTIRLKYETPGVTQNVYYGIDTGRENIGAGASDEIGNCLHMSRIKTNNKTIKKRMQDRAQYRKERKRHKRIKEQRKAIRHNTTIQKGKDDVLRTKKTCKSKSIAYPGMEKSVTHKVIQGAEAQFNNRTRDDGWLTPSGRQLIQMHIKMLDEARKFLPITQVCMERVCFDFQKLENANIKSWEYSKGPLYGFKGYKNYINARQVGKCLICGKKHIDEYHHIVPKSQGGTDRASNIVGLCEDCHRSIDGVHKSKDAQSKMLDLVGEQCQFHSISLLNSVMPVLIEAMQKYCDKHKLTLIITDGYQTAKIRKALGLNANKTDKDGGHHIDAYCISLAGRKSPNINDVYFPDVLHSQQRFKKKSNNNINALNQREYWSNGECVAKNRHKAMEQKEDSFEEYMNKYSQTHTLQECARHAHELITKPAKRTYTFHKNGGIAPIHAGDTVKYEKKNKIKDNTKRLIFVATNIVMSEQKARCGSKNKLLKFCQRIQSGCLPYIGCEKMSIRNDGIDNSR